MGFFALAIVGGIISGFTTSGSGDTKKDASVHRYLVRANRLEAQAHDKEQNDLQSQIEFVNGQSQTRLFTGVSLTRDNDARFTIDGNVWETLSEQDRRLTFQTFSDVWVKVFKRYHPRSQARISMHFWDLSGQLIEGDIFNLDGS